MVFDPEKQLPGDRNTVNERWFDALVRHQIFLLRTAGSVRNDIIEILNESEADLRSRIRDRLRAGPNLQRAEALIQEIRDLRAAAMTATENLWLERFRELVVMEANFASSTIRGLVPVELETAIPAGATLRALVRERPFEGRTLRDWARNIRQADIDRISAQIRIGVTQGEPVDVIARRVVGTARLRGSDGVTQITRGNAAALTRTAVIHFTNSAREEFFLQNRNIATREVWVATLDSRTCPICRALDGQRFQIGEGRKPPAHIGCRCVRVQIIEEDLIGQRPFKSTTERQLVEEFSEQEGLNLMRFARSALPRGTRGRFDEFARRTIRNRIGRVPAKVTYDEWLRTQSAAFQDDVLGPTRARLFRQGNLTLDKFVNRRGDEIPLSQLAQREAQAFREAGVEL